MSDNEEQIQAVQPEPQQQPVNEAIIIDPKPQKKIRKPKSPIEKIECEICHSLIRKYDLKRHQLLNCNVLPPPAAPVPIPKQASIQAAPAEPDISDMFKKLIAANETQKVQRYRNMMSKYYNY